MATIIAFFASASLATALNTNSPEYEPFKNVMAPSYERIKIGENFMGCMVSDYDRNGDYKVDLVETRVLKQTKEGHVMWEDNPYSLFVDDDFDGFADRFFMDKERDGIFEYVEDLKGKNLVMGDIR